MRYALVCVWCAACAPSAGPSLAIVDAPRVIALRGTPAEAQPGGNAHLDALVASPDGSVDASLDWSLCMEPRPLTTNDAASPACFGQTSLLAHSDAVDVSVPDDACQRFGPDPAPAQPGMPAPRPVAADASGGWYQPYRADLDGAKNLGLLRIRCNLSGASMDVAAQFRMEYQPNTNPSPSPITADGAPADGATLAAGAKVTLSVGWPEPERYPVLDIANQTLVEHREAMRVSWYVSAGTLAEEHTGVAGDDPALSTSNTLTAPASGDVHIWAVLRDDRGGVGWSHARITVSP